MPPYAFFHNQFVPLAEAKIGIMTHALHYGTAIFEGIRGNWNSEQEQIYIFRLKEHYQRLENGCRLLRINLLHPIEELCQITVELVRKKEAIIIEKFGYSSP